MYWLGLDLETTGLDTAACEIIEIGAVLWDVEAKTPVDIYSSMIKLPPGVSLTKEITEITGITPEMLEQFGYPFAGAVMQLRQMLLKAAFVVAHNGQGFDRPIIQRVWRKNQNEEFPGRPWIDTTTDVPYNEKIRGRSLTLLAAEHRFLNPFPHRAVFDVMTMLVILSNYDPEIVVKRALSPRVLLQAVVGYADNKKAKDRGYRWNPEKRMWLKMMLEEEAGLEKIEADFEVKELREILQN